MGFPLDRIVMLAFVLVLGTVIDRLRRDSWRVLVPDVVGYAVFLAGLWWAQEIGDGAFYAAAVASAGTLMFAWASGRRNLERARTGA